MTATLRTSVFLLSLLTAFAGSASQKGERATDDISEASAQEAHHAHDAYVDAINSNNLETFLATVTEDIVFLPPSSPPIAGKAAVGEWVEGYFSAYRSVWTKTSREFEVRGDLAYEWYAYESVDTPLVDGPAAGTPVIRDTGNGVNIYRRDSDGIWRVSRDVWASDGMAADSN